MPGHFTDHDYTDTPVTSNFPSTAAATTAASMSQFSLSSSSSASESVPAHSSSFNINPPSRVDRDHTFRTATSPPLSKTSASVPPASTALGSPILQRGPSSTSVTPDHHPRALLLSQPTPSNSLHTSPLSASLHGLNVSTPNTMSWRLHADALGAAIEDDPARLGFVAGHVATHPVQASWGAPAIDAAQNPTHLSASSLCAPLRAAPVQALGRRHIHSHLYGHLHGHVAHHARINSPPVMNDPWAQSAVWRPSAPHPVVEYFPKSSPSFSSFVSALERTSPDSLSSFSPFGLPSNTQTEFTKGSKGRSRRSGRAKDGTSDSSHFSTSTKSPVWHTAFPISEASSDLHEVQSSHPDTSAAFSSLPGRHIKGSLDHNRGSRGSKGAGRVNRAASGHMSVRDYNRRISACARRHDLGGALRVLAELDCTTRVSRNLFTYNAVINALVMCSQISEAEKFWCEMQNSGIEPNLVTFNTMLKSCFNGTDEDVNRAFALLKEMEDRGITPDRVTLNSLINACVSAGRVQDAQEAYERMRQLNIEPDAYTFCTLAKQARHECDVSMLDALLLHQLHHHSALQRRTVSPQTPPGGKSSSSWNVAPVAYNTIADAYIRCGYPSRAISLLERMGDPRKALNHSAMRVALRPDAIPVRPDVQTYNVRLKALRELGASTSDAFEVLAEMRSQGFEADHITLLTLADLCCRREEMALAEKVLHSATESDIAASEKGTMEWKSLCSSRHSAGDGIETSRCTLGKNTYGRNDARVHGSMHVLQSQPYGNRRNANQPRDAKANASLFNALIRGYASLDPPNIDAAVKLYLDMRRFVETYGFAWYAADSVTYTMLVDGFARIGDFARAGMIVSEMESAGRSNVVAYNAYLKANRGNGFKSAMTILGRMKRVGLQPDVITYNTVIDYLSSEENGVQIAEDLVLRDMPRNGVTPDLLTFNTLIKGAARNRGNAGDIRSSLVTAYKWLHELQSRGLQPDEFTYQSMVSACAAAGDAPRALEFFRKVEAERSRRMKGGDRSNCFYVSERGRMPRNIDLATSEYANSVSLSGRVANSDTTGAQFDGCAELSPVKATLSSKQQDNWLLLPHPAAYIALMRAFLSKGKDGVDSVLVLRDEMMARGLELGRTGHTAVADAYAEHADFDSVEVTLREMRDHDADPRSAQLSAVHHCIRMKALCNAGRLDDAIAILPEVESPDTAVFNILIFACARNNDMNRMMIVLRTMQACRVEPDAITNRALRGTMRNLAQTLKSFDKRFRTSITSLINSQESVKAMNQEIAR